jgi:hypothetical protein
MAELPLALGNVPKTAENHTEVPTKINWSLQILHRFLIS